MQHQIIDVSVSLFSEQVQVFGPLEQYNATPFTPKPYDVSKNVENQHHVFRFGHTNNIDNLVHQVLGYSEDTANDYIVGIFSAAMLILGVALIWFMVILGLQIAGQKKVGFLAGRLEHPDYGKTNNEAQDSTRTLPTIDEEPSTEGEIDQSLLDFDTSPLLIGKNLDSEVEVAKREKKFNRKVFIVRMIFIFSGISVIVSGALFYAKGVVSFQSSLGTAHGGLKLVQQTANKAINLTNNLLSDKDRLLNDLNQTKEETGDSFCEGDGELATTIKQHMEDLQAEIGHLVSDVENTVLHFGDDLRTLVSITEDVDDSLRSVYAYFYVAVSVSVIIGVLIMAMLIVTYFSAKGVSNCCTKFTTNAILWPIFVFFLLLFWIFSLLALVTSLAGADFCVKPDAIVEDVLTHFQDHFHSVIFEYLIYYVSGCSVHPKAESNVGDISGEIRDVIVTVHSLSESLMGASLPELEKQCGLDMAAASALQGGAELLHGIAHEVNKDFIQIRHILECKSFNPIYTTFVHDAVCVEAVGGLTWLYTTSFSLAIFSMMMITFRAALYPVKRSPDQA